MSAEPARAHLVWLSRRGIGRRAVSAASDVSATVLHQVRLGRQTQIRARTERRILAVDATCVSDGALVDARPSMRLIQRLLDDGYPALRLCRFLGYKGSGLQFRERWITARNAQRIAKLHRELMAEAS